MTNALILRRDTHRLVRSTHNPEGLVASILPYTCACLLTYVVHASNVAGITTTRQAHGSEHGSFYTAPDRDCPTGDAMKGMQKTPCVSLAARLSPRKAQAARRRAKILASFGATNHSIGRGRSCLFSWQRRRQPLLPKSGRSA
jgi:hypothetical protein